MIVRLSGCGSRINDLTVFVVDDKAGGAGVVAVEAVVGGAVIVEVTALAAAVGVEGVAVVVVVEGVAVVVAAMSDSKDFFRSPLYLVARTYTPIGFSEP